MSELMKKALAEIEQMYFAGAALDAAIEKIKNKYSGYLSFRSETYGELHSI
jgi:hypothetical protein